MTELNRRIQQFYDGSTDLWLDTWGEHMHHGYYGQNDGPVDHRQAQLRLITELLQWGKVQEAARILDAGCGVGGSARVLAELYKAEVLGCTLSPVQAQRAHQFNLRAGLEERVEIQARDMMSLEERDGPFDLIWSMESAEHIRDKQALMDLFHRLLAPGGRLLMATWFHRDTPPALSEKEEHLLQGIYRRYHLPPMVSIPELHSMAEETGFQKVRTADWTEQVAPFWKAVIRTALSWKGIKGLLKTDWATIQGAWAMRSMVQGYRRGIIKFGVLQAQKI